MMTPYLEFTRTEWSRFRKDAPLTLTISDLDSLKGHTEAVSLSEVEEIYLPLSRLLSFHVIARQHLYQVTQEFLGNPEPKVPYIIGVAGSVAVGKSTTSRVLKALLSRWPHHPNVEIITTDGFLYSNKELEYRELMHRKGFPESYDMKHLLRVLNDIKAGKSHIRIPVYSHHLYDILENKYEIINHPDIIILEGLNILQTGIERNDSSHKTFVSDFLDFSLFVDADIATIKSWYITRVLSFWNSEFRDPRAYFHYLTAMEKEEVTTFAEKVWEETNKINLIQNILPFKHRAQIILIKKEDHSVQRVCLRKL